MASKNAGNVSYLTVCLSKIILDLAATLGNRIFSSHKASLRYLDGHCNRNSLF